MRRTASLPNLPPNEIVEYSFSQLTIHSTVVVHSLSSFKFTVTSTPEMYSTNITEKSNEEAAYLPGQPLIPLHDTRAVLEFLLHDMIPDDLSRISGRLWWMSKQDSSNISPLHRQKVKGCEIIITEKPRLHLVWAHDRIFIKPLPSYLLTGPILHALDPFSSSSSSHHADWE